MNTLPKKALKIDEKENIQFLEICTFQSTEDRTIQKIQATSLYILIDM